ncbi:MAG: DUF6288 domain-containing protein [Akkermansiaceae bacterium]
MKLDNVDLTKGGSIPKAASHDWSLGATGARGWMYSSKLETSEARQVAVTEVAMGSPAAGVLKTGDVILGVGGKAFSYDPRTEFGKALTVAESQAGGGKLELMIWRSGKNEKAIIQLPVLGDYSATAPFECAKSKKIFEQGSEALAKRMSDPKYRSNPITRSLNALALLASGDAKYLPLVRKEAQWAADYQAESFQTWYYGYTIMLLSEYVIATGDQSVMPGLKRLALESANGQSMVGSWGHKFAGTDRRLMGYGMMNAPGVPLTTALAMARMAGVKDPVLDVAIERSAKLVRFYIEKGALPYGDHHPWIQTHEDNGKCGMAAVMFQVLNETYGAEFFSRMSVASHGSERDQGHTGNFLNLLWAMPGVALSGPSASGAWMKEFGSWYFDLARQWDGTFVHQGPPAAKPDSYRNWDSTGAYLLAYAMPLKKIVLTGKLVNPVPQLDAPAAAQLVNDGRGWSNGNRNSAYDQLGAEELMTLLGNWSPVVRERAAMALGRRKGDFVPALIKMLEAPQLEQLCGACQALIFQKGKAAPAVPALQELLKHEDLWVRIKATEALSTIGKPAMAAVPYLLEMLARGPNEADPRGMEQRFLSFALFGTLLKNSLDGVDRDLLGKAVGAGLQNQDGRARSAVGGAYRFLSYEDIKPLLPAIHRAIVEPAPSGIMFASGVRLSGVEVLAKHRIREGMALCLEVMEIDKWGKRDRIGKCLKTLEQYGGAAKPVLPQLRQFQKDLEAHREAKGLKDLIDQLKDLIKTIESSKETIELRGL